ncbi:hypothetical protein HCU74_08300 [Spongiibacter sp. KMU-166]|uniref:Fungal N-terminal domain-containing protein n=1 Tax=Spongiibacter thalassae TaxID=2721624 RepID=A0ABX1GES2_9GAMM|nr:hypothetical protein [Spongiibacter thalassae]NKI17416.1 hypothetical protein [Spongiibacter thalassae]
MADPSSLQVAVISASAAIAGAVISQVIALAQASLDRKHRRRILLRERYEQLADHITDSQEWPNTLLTCASHDELSRVPHPMHARKALTLSSIYFPELQGACQRYLNSCVSFRIFLIDNYRPCAGSHEVGNNIAAHNPTGLDEAAKKALLARQAIDEKIIKLASKYARA